MGELNDPYEYKMFSKGMLQRGRIDENVFIEAMELLDRTILKDSKIACFVKSSIEECDAFNLPFTKPRSWAQYGEEQYGVCFVFDKPALLKEIDIKIDGITVYPGPVSYDLCSDSVSQKNCLNYNNSMTTEENISSHIKMHSKDIFFRKYNDFSGENEYRIILVDRLRGRRQYLFCPLEGVLKAVILGERFHEVYRGLIRERCHSYSAKTYTLSYGRVPYISELKVA